MNNKTDFTKKNCKSCQYTSFCKGKSILTRLFGCKVWTRQDYDNKYKVNLKRRK